MTDAVPAKKSRVEELLSWSHPASTDRAACLEYVLRLRLKDFDYDKVLELIRTGASVKFNDKWWYEYQIAKVVKASGKIPLSEVDTTDKAHYDVDGFDEACDDASDDILDSNRDAVVASAMLAALGQDYVRMIVSREAGLAKGTAGIQGGSYVSGLMTGIDKACNMFSVSGVPENISDEDITRFSRKVQSAAKTYRMDEEKLVKNDGITGANDAASVRRDLTSVLIKYVANHYGLDIGQVLSPDAKNGLYSSVSSLIGSGSAANTAGFTSKVSTAIADIERHHVKVIKDTADNDELSAINDDDVSDRYAKFVSDMHGDGLSDLVDFLSLSRSRLNQKYQFSKSSVSLDLQTGDDGSGSLHDIIPDKSNDEDSYEDDIMKSPRGMAIGLAIDMLAVASRVAYRRPAGDQKTLKLIKIPKFGAGSSIYTMGDELGEAIDEWVAQYDEEDDKSEYTKQIKDAVESAFLLVGGSTNPESKKQSINPDVLHSLVGLSSNKISDKMTSALSRLKTLTQYTSGTGVSRYLYYIAEYMKDEYPEMYNVIITAAKDSRIYGVVPSRFYTESEEMAITVDDMISECEHSGRNIMTESVIFGKPVLCASYAAKVIGGRWPEAEKFILESDAAMTIYKLLM